MGHSDHSSRRLKVENSGGSVARLMQMRRAGLLGLVVWPLFGLLDWFIVSYIQPGPLEFYLALRTLGLVLLGLTVGVLYARKNMSSTMLTAIETFMITALTILLAVQCLEFRGIASPLALGVVTILLGRSAILSVHWKHSILPVSAATVAYPLTFVVLSQISPAIRAQMQDPQALAQFALHQAFLVAAAIITVIGGHLVWRLRKQIADNTSLGRYKLKKLIGEGGMGEVWSAYHHAMRRKVAVKILRPSSKTDPTAVARFEREVRATAELSHPNTVRVYDYGVTEDGLWYYAMELLQGEDLGSVLSRGPVSPSRATDIIHQASRALAEAHSRGMVHRDVKPENIFLTSLAGECDFVKVLDFGLVRTATEESQVNLTQTGWAVGTPSFVSPEVVTGKTADPRSDVYALGAVLYALLAGQAPFAADDMRAVLMAHLRETPIPPSQRLGRALPGDLEAVVMRCLEKNPEDRFASAAELAQALAGCQARAALPHHAMAQPLPHKSTPRPRRAPTNNGHARPRPRAISERPEVTIRQVGDPAPTFLTRADWRKDLASRKIGADADTIDEQRTIVRHHARY